MPKRILLADDSITIQKVVELTFSDGDYEVTAVNNGAKAIQKLSEMRPDIILSDIIMPEKNGYEVCEYVKSHPEYRTIPVVLLTGTFEPFDPDRADKAGCDAVVTKPFESQSLIHKVEELIQSAASSASAQRDTPASAQGSPWSEEPAPPSRSGTGTEETPFESAGGSDLFGAAPARSSPADTPFQSAPEQAYSGETRAFPRMSFDDLKNVGSTAAGTTTPSSTPPPPPAREPSPWADEPPVTGGETRAFPQVSRDELERMAKEKSASGFSSPSAPEPPTESPFGEMAPAGGERAFPPMSFDDLPKSTSESAAPASPLEAPELSPWEQPPPVGGETRAFPQMSFEQLQRMAEEKAPPESPKPEPSSPWEEQPSGFASETPGPTPIDFEIQSSAPLSEPSQPSMEANLGSGRYEGIPFSASEEAPLSPAQSQQSSSGAPSGELTEEQIDRIARRVVQLMSVEVVRTIAWEVIPDMAEMVVKERIRQLENE